jgi:quinol monooxygenase YgiN
VLIRHIVFFSAKRPGQVDAVEAGLWKLAEIPHSSHFEVARNSKVDPLCDAIDVVVYAEFADEAALAAYKAHPLYAETTAKVRPMRELRFSADFAAFARVKAAPEIQ